MKVKDLIEELQNYNPEAYVDVMYNDDAAVRIRGISYCCKEGQELNKNDCDIVDILVLERDEGDNEFYKQAGLDGNLEVMEVLSVDSFEDVIKINSMRGGM